MPCSSRRYRGSTRVCHEGSEMQVFTLARVLGIVVVLFLIAAILG